MTYPIVNPKLGSLALAILLALVQPVTSRAQKFKVQDVTLEDLTSTHYEKDSTADAVVLFDIGKLNASNFEFSRRMRIKILKKSGLQWGNWVFNLPSRADFKITVYNIENGVIVREKATPKTIYEEEVVENFFVFKVFAPGVKVGSVIDIYFSHIGPPSEWRFQQQIPVAYSELTLEPTAVGLNTAQFGFEPIEAFSPYQWRATNMPAFLMEPYLNDYSNYITKFSIGIREYRNMRAFTEVGVSWKAVNYYLNQELRIRDALNGGQYLKEFVRATKEKQLSPSERIQAAYDYVQANLKWDQRKTIFPSAMLRNNFIESHNGNSADINLTLVCLLKQLDVTTYPVVLSTRDNGLLLAHSPDIYKLNYVVAYVKHDDIDMLIDATVAGIMPGVLPAYCLNGSGLIMQEETENWVELTSRVPSVKRQFISISLDKSGHATATVSNMYTGYGYLSWLENYKEHNRDADRIKNKIQKENPDVTLTKYEIVRDEPAKLDCRENLEVDMSELVVDAGQETLISPFVLNELSANPFLAEKRKYPVDLNFPREMVSTVTIPLNGYALKQLPQSVRISIPDKSATFIYTAGTDGRSVQLKMVMKIERQIYTETEYQDLRRFFSEVVKKVGSMVELSKT